MKKPSATDFPSEQAQAFGQAMGDVLRSLGGVSIPAPTLAQVQADYLSQATALWNQALEGAKGEHAPAAIKDRRFSAPSWSADPGASFLAQMYLLNARALTDLAESMQTDAKTKARLRFAVQQWVDAASPSNYLATNPDALRLAVETRGESLSKGVTQLFADLQKGHVSQTDESVFEVGRNVATSEGAVVFENDLFQLIEYKPLTAKVYERPMLFVPPCINKYYILDLQPENSVIRYTVQNGHHLYVVSWRNPDDSMKSLTWDDYIERGPIAAINEVCKQSGSVTLNTLGFCVGGTLLTTALAVLAGRGKQPAHSVTLLTTLLDFADNGILDVFVDEAAVQLREMTLGAESPTGPGLLKGKELATTFSFLRPNDLVWNYVVANYLKGEKPPAFDLLYWNGDSTNLPGPMYCWYLRHTYLQNELKVPGRLTVCGQKVNIGAIKAPVYVYGSREDHIVPWTSAYGSVPLFKGKRRFVLGASGHIAGVINPPAANKRCHWVNDQLPASATDWLASAKEVPGSWWPDWSRWLAPQGGKQVAAPNHFGGKTKRSIEPAPGRYVKAKA